MSDLDSCESCGKEITIKIYSCSKCEEAKPKEAEPESKPEPESEGEAEYEPRSYYGWFLAGIAAFIAYYAQGCA